MRKYIFYDETSSDISTPYFDNRSTDRIHHNIHKKQLTLKSLISFKHVEGDENEKDFGELSHDRGKKRRERKKRQRIVSK